MLLWSFPTFYKILEEVINTLLSKERRLNDENTETTDVSTLAVVENWKKDNSKEKEVWWGCKQLRHLKRDCNRRNGAEL